MKLAEEYGVSPVCRILELPRSTYYYPAQAQTEEERELVAALERLAGEWPAYGYRCLTAQLSREGYPVNSKRVRCLLAELGITRHPKARRVRTTNSQHGFGRFANLVEDLVVERPDQVWMTDVTYIRLQHEFVYLAVLMDVFTRHSRLASGKESGTQVNAEGTLASIRGGMSGDSSQ